jgi:ubiquinone/menaquinone biosynthesis C-methylase UbiE
MERQWSNYIMPFLSQVEINYQRTVDLACGHGRNSEKLAPLADRLVLVDVNPETLAFCKQKVTTMACEYVQTNGYDLHGISDNSVTFLYCFDAAVHFDLEIIISYIKEFKRILIPGAYGFVHHSNSTEFPGLDFRKHPLWRNFMSKEIFAHVCIRKGLNIVDQRIVDWGMPEYFRDSDCFSLFRKPI